MTKKAFLESLLSKKTLNEFEINKLTELTLSLNDEELEALSLKCAFIKFLNLKEVCNAYFEILDAHSAFFAQTHCIKGFKQTRLKEKELLKSFFFKKALKDKPKWLKETLLMFKE